MMKKGKEVFSRQREQNVLQELKGRMTGVGGARTNRTEVCRAACLESGLNPNPQSSVKCFFVPS